MEPARAAGASADHGFGVDLADMETVGAGAHLGEDDPVQRHVALPAGGEAGAAVGHGELEAALPQARRDLDAAGVQ